MVDRPTNQRATVLADLRALSSLCDPECYGRCRACPSDAVAAAIAYIEGVPSEPSVVLRQLVDEARGMCSDEWQVRADAALGIYPNSGYNGPVGETRTTCDSMNGCSRHADPAKCAGTTSNARNDLCRCACHAETKDG